MAQKLIIPGRLPSLNEYVNDQRANRYAGHKSKKVADSVVQSAITQSRLKPVQTYPIALKITYYEKNRRRDPDNFAFAKKFILDGLQKAGIITGDGWSQIQGWEESWEVDKENPRIEVLLMHTYKTSYP